ncbi:exotoxin beta-grasp domain-containing protein [Staphylococcus chromogenes]|uniref:exotoxin beta-grasp domain-containing protein n=1 Tax=Staphylococcus chromogenes TaxID=46126 RepID=UPI003EC000C6
MKKTISILLTLFTLIFCLSIDDSSAKMDEDKIKNLHEKSSLSELALSNAHIQYTHPFIQENISTTEIVGGTDLIFRNKGTGGNDLRVKFASKELAESFKDKNVDIYGGSYFHKCEKVSEKTIECLYGGTTLNKDKLETQKSIGINIFIDGSQKPTEFARTKKKNVTLQELDMNVRKILEEKYKIYIKDSNVNKGLIEFDMKTSENYSFDIYDLKGENDFEILKMYEDNKTLNVEDISHIDVYLYSK